MDQLKSRIQSFNTHEQFILMNVFLIFMNLFIQGVAFAGFALYALFHKEIRKNIQEQPGAIFIYSLFILEIIVSACSKNLPGVGFSLGLIAVFIFMAYYRKHINRRLFECMLEMMVWMSLFINVIGIIQFNTISVSKGYSFFDFHIFNSPKRRIASVYMNANYYAMVLEFLVVCCMVRFVQCKNVLHKLVYVIIGIFDLVMLYLTGCRAAFVPFVIMVPVFLFLSKEYKWAIASVVCIVIAGSLIYLFPNLIPRSSDISTVDSRVEIWKCAWLGIKESPFFGKGPFGYGVTWPKFNGHVAPHCHNIYIDLLLSYGIVGGSLILICCGYILKDISKMLKWKNHPEYFAMAIAFILIFLIHGFMDCTATNFSTGGFLLLILNLGAIEDMEDIV